MNHQGVKNTNVNDRIRASRVLVITEEGTNLGEMSIRDAINRAVQVELDLVEVGSGKSVPVCRIMDFGKWKYDQAKKIKKQKNHKQLMKEVKFRPNTGDNDLTYRASNTAKFLGAGHKVKLCIRFKGRELEHKYETGKSLLERFLALLDCEYYIAGEAKMEGRNIILFLSPEK